MKKLLPLFMVTFFGLSASLSGAAQPNVLVFFVDDMGWMDSEVNGSMYYESPAQQRLAEEGMVFTQAYAQPVCSPSRAALLSGQYPGARLHIAKAIVKGSASTPKLRTEDKPNIAKLWPGSRDHLPHEVYTIAESLKDQGFQTWHLGKWHLSPHLGPKDVNGHVIGGPLEHGFDKAVGVGGSGPGSYFAPYKTPEFPEGPQGEYISERMAQEACELLENRDETKPFFMYYACFNVHGPHQAKPELVEYYKKKLNRMPSDNTQKNPVMAAMLHAMDNELKTLLDKLDELKLTDNTIVVFASDNGGCNWEMNKKSKNKKPGDITEQITSNTPLRGGKCSWFEGGVRVPMIIRWPDQMGAGAVTDYPVHLVDIYPTVLAAGDLKLQRDQILDGRDLGPLFHDETLPERPLFCHFPRKLTTAGTPGASFIRLGDFKLVRVYGGIKKGGHDKYVLYNLKEDVGETTDVADQHPEKTARLKTMLNEWLKDTGALVPQPNPAYRF